MSEAHLLMAQVTDVFGKVEAEPLVVRVESGNVFFETEDGASWLVDQRELAAVVVPESDARAA
jgi:hypothetical protein